MGDQPKGVDPSWLNVLTDPVRLNVLHSLTILPTPTATELAAHTHSSDATLRRHLDALVALGLVHAHQGESDGETSGRPATRFLLDARARASASELFRVLERPLGSARRRTPPPPRGR